MGKRTKWQQDDKSQLVVTVDGACEDGSGEGGGGVDAPETRDEWWSAGTEENATDDEKIAEELWWHSDAPKDVTLDDDTLLDKIKFQNEETSNNRRWNPLEQAVVFCSMMDVGRRRYVAC